MEIVKKNLNENWKFYPGECEPAWYKGFDDSAWETVSLPHDWSVTLPFSKENSSGTGYVSGGIGWYRVRFRLPAAYEGKRVGIVFDGVYKNSQVWCNSYYLGKRPNGYVTFYYDLTPFVCFGGEENEISVKVTHTDLADSRWFTGSGITRAAHLLIQEPVHPAMDGVFFETVALEENGARLRVTQELVNESEKAAQVEVLSQLVDDGGNIVLSLEGKILAPAAEGYQTPGGYRTEEPRARETAAEEREGAGRAALVLEGTLKAPRLWSTDHPCLYVLRTFYGVDGGKPELAHEDEVGIRSICFDPDRGFFLNEKPMKLKGVCVHHDGGCLGAAMKAEVWQRRLAVLKECGCNAIRCSHNPHMPELYALCDRMGFLMMDEAFDEWENPKNKWSAGHNVYPPGHQGYFEDFPQWHEADLRAMVRRDRNHPSVILWSIGNEIDYPNDPYCHPMFEDMTGNNDANKPLAERVYDSNKPNAKRLAVLAAHLAAIVKSEDKSRPVTLAAAFPELSSRIGFLDALDVAGYNYKEHLYEEDHRRFPQLPFLGSENGHSYEAWMAVAQNDFISGQFLWTGIDYLGEAHGWPVRGSQAGILTCAGDKKPEFYRRCSFWKEEPVLHLATKRLDNGQEGRAAKWAPFADHWNYAEGETVRVECFSNLAEAVLSLNGEEIGRQKGCNKEGTFAFDVPFRSGELVAEGLDEAGTVRLTQRLSTAGKAEKMQCTLWREPDLLTQKGWEQAGQETGYLYQISLLLTDAEGRPAAWDDRNVTVSVSGAGELAGLESGDLSDVTSYACDCRKTCQGRLWAYIRRKEPGTVTVAVNADMAGGVVHEIHIS